MRIYLECGTCALKGNKHIYPPNSPAPILGDATHLVRSGWLYVILEPRKWHEEAITRGPQLSSRSQSICRTNNNVSWFPFDFGADLWAYVDGCLIRLEVEETAVTFFHVEKFS